MNFVVKQKLCFLFVPLMLLLFASPIQASSGPIKDQNYTITSNIEISLPASATVMAGGIDLNGNYEVNTDSVDHIVTINLVNPSGSNSSPHYGIIAQNGASVTLGKVIINGGDGDDQLAFVGGLGTFNDGSFIKIGDYSEIYAKNNGFVITVNNDSTIKIGAHAKLHGNANSTGLVTVSEGIVEIGDNAEIYNDSTGVVLGISPDTDMQHMGIFAYNGGEIIIGAQSHIETNGIALNLGVVAGVLGYSGTGTVTLKDNVTVTTSGMSSYGLYAQFDGSTIKTGNDVIITAHGNNSGGVASGQGAVITLGNRNHIETTGNNSFAIVVEGVTPLDAKVIVGNDSVIVTGATEGTGTGSHGLVLIDSGFVTLGTGTSVTVHGTNADVINLSGTLSSESFSYEGVLLESKQGNLITNDTGSTLEIIFDGTETKASFLKGSIEGLSKGSHIEMTLKNFSTWEGVAKENTDIEISLALFTNAAWIVTQDSFINEVTTNALDSTVKLKLLDDGFIDLKIGKLSGQGTIEMNVDMSEGNESGDYIKIDDASGNHRLVVTGTQSGASTLDVIEVVSGNAEFYLKNDKADIGAHKYILNNRVDSGTTYWFLELYKGLNPIVEKVTAGSIGMIQAVKAFDNSLALEGIKKNEGFFVNTYYKNQFFDKLEVTQGQEVLDLPSYDQDNYGLIVGYNRKVGGLLGGIFIGASRTNQNFDDDSEGKINIFTLGLQTNAEIFGLDLYAYARVGWYNQKYSIVDSSSDFRKGEIKTIGFSSSAMLSKKIKIFDNKFYITPKAKLMYTYISNHEFIIGNISEFYSSPENGLQTWLGLTFGQDIKLDNRITLGYHVDAAWIHDASNAIVIKIEDETLNVDVSRNMLYLGLGLEFSIENTYFNHVSLDINHTRGANMKETFAIQLESSWNF